MPIFWRNFYLRQGLLLAASGLGLLLLFHLTRLDILLEDAWFTSSDAVWPLRNAWWSRTLIHQWLRYFLILAALGCIVLSWKRRHAVDALRWRVVGAACVVIPLAVSLGKRASPMHCPWDVDRYGGAAPYFDLFSAVSTHITNMGHCFPAGFVSCASWLFAFALLRYPEQPRASLRIWLGVAALCLAMGAVQQMRGAHFFSHVLWTLWLSWALVVLLHATLGAWRTPAGKKAALDGTATP